MNIHPVDAAAMGAVIRSFRRVAEELTHDEERRGKFFRRDLVITEPILSPDTKGGLSSILNDVGGNDPWPDWDSPMYLEVRLRSMNDVYRDYFQEIEFMDQAAGEIDRNARRREIFRRTSGDD